MNEIEQIIISPYVTEYRCQASAKPNLVNEKDELLNFLQMPNDGFFITRMKKVDGKKFPIDTKEFVFVTNQPLITELINGLSQLEQ